MRSMTGYGAGAAPLDDGRIVVEVRSLNHRYLEVRTNMAPELASYAYVLEQRARKQLERGRYDIAAKVEGTSSTAPRLDRAKARAAFRDLAALRDELAPETPLTIDAVVAAVGDLFAAPVAAQGDATHQALERALDEALGALDAMQRAEGAALAVELGTILGRLRANRDAIIERSDERGQRHRERLRERLDKLLTDIDVEVDPSRLEVELALLADRTDTTEELARLESHFDQLGALLESEGAIGRRIDFLLQEVGREANTIASKCQDAATSHHVVEMKADIERLRQQIQNVA